MAQTVSVIVSAEERVRLAAIVGDRSRPLKHVQRARIVLHSADRLPVLEVARRASVSRPAVWRWQRRYAEEGVDGLLHDKTRPPGTAPVPMTTVAKVLALTCAEPPGETTHWTGRAMATAVGLSLRTIQRIWEAHRLQPHRLRTFKRSKECRAALEKFAEKGAGPGGPRWTVQRKAAVIRAVRGGWVPINEICETYNGNERSRSAMSPGNPGVISV